MSNKLQNTILHHCQLKNNAVFLDGNCYFENKEAADFPAFAKSLYKFLALKYPKFYKMDAMSKLGFLTFECLLQKVDNFANLNHQKTGIFLANKSSSLQTDEKYWATTQDDDGHPSPSLFVYTLPNIVIGEMCIRHKIKGEHAFFVFESFDARFICQYVNDLIDNGQIEACAVGWVERYQEEAQANFVWVAKGGNGDVFEEGQLEALVA